MAVFLVESGQMAIALARPWSPELASASASACRSGVDSNYWLALHPSSAAQARRMG
jgi:hypothetical protein